MHELIRTPERNSTRNTNKTKIVKQPRNLQQYFKNNSYKTDDQNSLSIFH